MLHLKFQEGAYPLIGHKKLAPTVAQTAVPFSPSGFRLPWWRHLGIPTENQVLLILENDFGQVELLR